MADPYVREVGRVADMDGIPCPVGVDYDAVTIGAYGYELPYRFTAARSEEFAQLFVSATKGPSLHLATGTCRVREPEVAPGG